MFWLELEPASGVSALHTLHQGRPRRLTADGYSMRSRVNGYGGGALCLLNNIVYGVNADTGQVDRIEAAGDPSCIQPQALTRTPAYRYGGLVADAANRRLLAVREQVAPALPNDSSEVQALVAITLDGQVTVLHQGQGFYGAATVASDGRQLAWVCWQWPHMPWQESNLWLADVDDGGRLVNPRVLPAPVSAAVQQPQFQGSELYAVSDHQGWWQPCRVDAVGVQPAWVPATAALADHANAPWQLAERHYLPLPDGGWVGVRYVKGSGELWRSSGCGQEVRLAPGYTDFRSLCLAGGTLYCLASRWDALTEVLAVDLANGQLQVLAGGELPWPAIGLSRPEPFSLPATTAELPATGFYYPPAGSPTEPPPLLVLILGGPPSASYPVLRPEIQFWCRHGFAVADLNYRGSTGFGRAFRLGLQGRWGQVDVDDACAAVAYLAAEGLADGDRAFIQGRSSGGYTALMAMVGSTVFRGAVSLFGVTDPWHLQGCTHRFESGYLDWLLGAAASAEDWQDRTPARLAERMTGPVLFFQGGQDTVVVPAQTEAMAAAMTAAGLDTEVHRFPDEGHGFRRQVNQVSVLTQSLAFYQRLCHQPVKA
ncbi:alpha/beta hydrolase family protein [Marinobacter zhejiangensis]|uniref:alpha/beta hydrolase family protein n=1 Tax=Marinobacter zhejiangensis TaxID=488535 RepID=UPI000AAD7CEA|nr:prolyl oligopeptidase family serine peptidase [Marinobacter zhejiangensis]